MKLTQGLNIGRREEEDVVVCALKPHSINSREKSKIVRGVETCQYATLHFSGFCQTIGDDLTSWDNFTNMFSAAAFTCADPKSITIQ